MLGDLAGWIAIRRAFATGLEAEALSFCLYDPFATALETSLLSDRRPRMNLSAFTVTARPRAAPPALAAPSPAETAATASHRGWRIVLVSAIYGRHKPRQDPQFLHEGSPSSIPAERAVRNPS